MKPAYLLPLAAASAITAEYVCPANTSSIDASAIAYAYTIQGLIEAYYNSVPVNASFFSDLSMASMTASNGMTLAENTVTNVEGLTTQAKLAATALMEEGGMLGLSPPACTFTLPMAPNGTAHLMNAFHLEASLCGAFIGLADVSYRLFCLDVSDFRKTYNSDTLSQCGGGPLSRFLFCET